MGGTFSSGQDNDELVDNLVHSRYIRSKNVEQVFRAVDRGDYFLSSHRDDAYKDFAWKHGNIHLSAPCIYCEVMEELALKPGLSFLNLGSGTGYLNTMAGLLLTQTGTNHGIELHEDCVKYSYDRLEEFKQKSLAVDQFDFCEPTFVQGNCLNVPPGRRYDRVYCGAACPESHEAIIKEFVKVGGILVMPFKDHLVKIKRTAESEWEQKIILPVSFTTLIIPPPNESACQLPDCHPLSLQELCRGKIRRRLRHNIWVEHLDLGTRKPISSQRRRERSPPRILRHHYVIPIFEESDENLSDGNEESQVHGNQLLLRLDGPPGENLRTTLQIVRTTDLRQNHAGNGDNGDVEDDYINWPYEEESPSTEEDTPCDTNFSSERERQDSESSSEQDSACEKSQSEGNNADNSDKLEGRPGPTSSISQYLNMSESESDQDDGNERNGNREARLSSHRQSTSTSKKKPNRTDKGDSGIVDDACNIGNDEASFSSDSDFANGTPVKHKRSSPSTRNNNDSGSEPSSKRSPLKTLDSSDKVYTLYVDTNAFSSYMKEKIHQLPLPHSLKLYVNYNRNL